MTNTETTAPALPVYVDPFPGKKGTDYVREECVFCTDGVYGGASGHTWARKVNGVWVTNKWCYRCQGLGYFSVRVSSVRARVRREVKRQIQAIQDAPRIEAERKARLAAEIEFAHIDALAEQARRDAMNNDVLGEVGAKIRDLAATVRVATTYDASFGFSKQIGSFLVLETDDHRFVKVAGTGSTLFGHKRDDRVTIKLGTVKDHSEYKGQVQTNLTRVKLEKLA